MKKILFVVTSVAMFSGTACSQRQKGFSLTGKIEGLNSKELHLVKEDGSRKIVPVNADGSFIVRDTIGNASPQLYILRDPSGMTLIKNGAMMGIDLNFFAKDGNDLSIQGAARDFRWLKVTGSALNDQLGELRAQLKPVQQEELKIWNQVREVMNERNPAKNAAKIDSLQQLTDPYVAQARAIRLKFVHLHPGQPAGALALKEIASSTKVEDLKALYASLDKQVRELSFLSMVREQIGQKEGEKNTQYGMPAPDFVKLDKDGKEIRLSDYRGKYVLLDFWGSWCGPCRASHPHLKEVAEKYKADGLVVIGIAEERSKSRSAWLKAISQDGLPWTQIMNDEGKEKTDVVSMFGVKSFPTKILIDKEGKIILRYEGTTMSAGAIGKGIPANGTDTSGEGAAAGNTNSASGTATTSSSASSASSGASTSSASASSAISSSTSTSASSGSVGESDTPLDKKLKEIFKR